MIALTARKVRVTAVHDGDSIKVDDLGAGLRYWIRVEGIDAPEVYAPGFSIEQNSGPEAGQFLRDLVKGKDIEIVEVGRDGWGRRLCTVWFEGQELGDVMVKRGWAWSWPGSISYNRLRRLQGEAKRKGIGLWAFPGAVRPATWRKRKMKMVREVADPNFWADEVIGYDLESASDESGDPPKVSQPPVVLGPK